MIHDANTTYLKMREERNSALNTSSIEDIGQLIKTRQFSRELFCPKYNKNNKKYKNKQQRKNNRNS
jgi:hypothetical protein